MQEQKKAINYIGFYGLQDGFADEQRLSFPSAVRKMDYICDALAEAGYHVNIVSPSYSQADRGFFKSGTTAVNPDKTVTLAPSFGTKSRVLKRLRVYLSSIWLALWLIIHLQRDEKILVYHSLYLMNSVRFARMFKKFKIVLEVEEIYCDVTQKSRKTEKSELKFISIADSLLFSTDLLAKRIDLRHRNFVVVLGEYSAFKRTAFPDDDGKIHLVYAGLIDTDITFGAFLAVECARYLPNFYRMHILGYGSNRDIALLRKKIDEINRLDSCTVVYDGLRKGNEYIEYINKCHIGLSTRKIDGRYLQSSFPSKVLSYLSMGLHVVSCNIDSVRRSKIGDLVTFYQGNEPSDIADSIQKVDLEAEYHPEERIRALHREFVNQIGDLICPENGSECEK